MQSDGCAFIDRSAKQAGLDVTVELSGPKTDDEVITYERELVMKLPGGFRVHIVQSSKFDLTHKKLKRLANDRQTTIQALMLEAVEAILAKDK